MLRRYIRIVEQWLPSAVAVVLFFSLCGIRRFGYDQRGIAVFTMLNWGAAAFAFGVLVLAMAIGLNPDLDVRLSGSPWNRRVFIGFFEHSVVGLIAFLLCSLGLASYSAIAFLPYWAASLAFAALATGRALYAAFTLVARTGASS